MINRLLHRLSIWLYHRFTIEGVAGIGYSGSPAVVARAVENTLKRELALGVAADVRVNFVPRVGHARVVVTLEFPA